MVRYRMPSGSTLAERLLYFSEPGPGGCRLWTGAKDEAGYGMLWIGGRSRRAHIVSWQEANGRLITPGMLACHTCDVPSCIEPTHVYEGTYASNAADRDAKGRRQALRGEQNARAKLTDQIVLAIRADGRAAHLIGAEIGVDPSTVNRVRRRELWAHIP